MNGLGTLKFFHDKRFRLARDVGVKKALDDYLAAWESLETISSENVNRISLDYHRSQKRLVWLMESPVASFVDFKDYLYKAAPGAITVRGFKNPYEVLWLTYKVVKVCFVSGFVLLSCLSDEMIPVVILVKRSNHCDENLDNTVSN